MEEFNYPLNFSDDKYKKCALGIRVENMTDEPIIESEEAFMILIKDLNQGNLSNLITKIKEYFQNGKNIELSEEDCYNLTQGKVVGEIEITSELKKKMLDLAYKCLDEGKNLGEASTSDGKFNTSAWISHSLYEARTAEILAKAMGVNSENAKVMGMFHDIGRRFVHTLDHTVRGFEYLIDNGIDSRIAACCLTHSFFNGGRNCYCDPAENGFYLDKDGEECFEGNIEVDDVTDFLRNYGKYNIYDLILNVADLMATDKGIIEPAKRIEDIVTRKNMDTNLYLLSEFTNVMKDFMEKMKVEIPHIEDLKVTSKIPLDMQKKIENQFKLVSEAFYKNFQKLMKIEELANQELTIEEWKNKRELLKEQYVYSEPVECKTIASLIDICDYKVACESAIFNGAKIFHEVWRKKL